MEDRPIKVISWNIRFGIDIDGAVAAIRDRPELQSPDVVLLQEMDRPGTEKLAEALGLAFVYASSGIHAKTGRDFGNAVLAAEPLRDEQVTALPHQARVGGQPRIALSANADLGGSPVHLCSVHTETPALSTPRRMEQYGAVARLAAGWSTERSIVGGDFNTMTRRGVRRLVDLFEEVEHVPASVEAATLRRGGQDFALDHIFSRALWPLATGVVRGLDASDHAPVWVVLESGLPRDDGEAKVV